MKETTIYWIGVFMLIICVGCFYQVGYNQAKKDLLIENNVKIVYLRENLKDCQEVINQIKQSQKELTIYYNYLINKTC